MTVDPLNEQSRDARPVPETYMLNQCYDKCPNAQTVGTLRGVLNHLCDLLGLRDEAWTEPGRKMTGAILELKRELQSAYNGRAIEHERFIRELGHSAEREKDVKALHVRNTELMTQLTNIGLAVNMEDGFAFADILPRVLRCMHNYGILLQRRAENYPGRVVFDDHFVKPHTAETFAGQRFGEESGDALYREAHAACGHGEAPVSICAAIRRAKQLAYNAGRKDGEASALAAFTARKAAIVKQLQDGIDTVDEAVDDLDSL